ncbi:hypothetical protein [Sinanaerobacter chloroacetimidivorans]|uniref:Uncharacterized protein n=1 Tax=Sinanaerobacter chloroacetimidivorans TaxID=2818044 RepID=A0A8J8AZ96_9FIRM|nr:hypothetical protein [Sinanaerobacter chloroacetimidivorans]MBR0596288.1 hypothetical protein [Sinanaerobacter chloroacetimidivorans]
MELGFGIFVLFLFGIFLTMLLSFFLSFAKHTCVSTIGFMIFTSMSAFFAFSTADEAVFTAPLMLAQINLSSFNILPVLCGMLSVVSAVLWFFSRRKFARTLGAFSVAAVMYIYLQV